MHKILDVLCLELNDLGYRVFPFQDAIIVSLVGGCVYLICEGDYIAVKMATGGSPEMLNMGYVDPANPRSIESIVDLLGPTTPHS
jgi:hypothetical protein